MKIYCKYSLLQNIIFCVFLSVLASLTTHANTYSLRFYGYGYDNADRVKIYVDRTNGVDNPLNIGASAFTIEWWMKAQLNENYGVVVPGENDNWVSGNIIIDRDIFGDGDFGNFGISLGEGKIAFGVNNGNQSRTLLGSTSVADGAWHHIAVTRRPNDGYMAIWVNGTNDANAVGPIGDISYNSGRSTLYTNDPYLVFGAEKHDYDPSTYPSFNGKLDMVRVSTTELYTATFSRPTEYFIPDAECVGLFVFNEGGGSTIINHSFIPNAPNGVRHVGGPNNGPVYDTDTPPLVPEPTAVIVFLFVFLYTTLRR